VEVLKTCSTSPSSTSISSWRFRLISTTRPLSAALRASGRTPFSKALRVLAPTTPSRPMPAAFCSAYTACWVTSPKLPSALPFQ
jgi:hypothetical protein